MLLHDARIIANTLIELAHKQDKQLTPMQVIKLVYLCAMLGC